jgi:pyruvate ferredoxin oxidoreductase delta subunit
MAEHLKNWQEIPIGGLIVEAGNAVEYNTGNWRAFRPVWDSESCTDCMLCWLHCPDASILVEGDKMVGIDLEHCKGCGLCVEVCAVKSISLHPESEFLEEAAV